MRQPGHHIARAEGGFSDRTLHAPAKLVHVQRICAKGMEDPFKVLGVDADADESGVRRAYRKLALRCVALVLEPYECINSRLSLALCVCQRHGVETPLCAATCTWVLQMVAAPQTAKGTPLSLIHISEPTRPY